MFNDREATLHRQAVRDSYKPAIAVCKDGQPGVMYMGRSGTEVIPIAAAEGSTGLSNEIVTVTGTSLVMEPHKYYELDASSAASVSISVSQPGSGVAVSQAWISLGDDTAVTLAENISWRTPGAASALKQGEVNHIVVQMVGGTGTAYVM